MNITVAIDSFKGSLTSFEAGNAIKKGILNAIPKANVTVCAIADGGEGTVEALASGDNASLYKVKVKGPLGDAVTADYAVLHKGNIAVMEMAKSSGITLISAEERNPMLTTTYGVGEMIKDAINRGCREFIIGIGGSATNDGGVGMLQALGFKLLDGNGKDVPFGASGVGMIREIRTDSALPELKECRFRIACDVNNPLCGELGCSAVFSRQKGADDEMIKVMDKYLYDYAVLTENTLGVNGINAPGAGAAGGLGFAFMTYLSATLEKGARLIMETVELEKYIKGSDLVVTGEGRLDEQTVMGKAPVGVSEIAVKYGIPVIAFSGAVTDGAGVCNSHGITAFFPILREICTLDKALAPDYAAKNLSNTAEQVFRIVRAFKK